MFLHQILAHVSQRGSVERGALWKALQGPVPFRRIDQGTFDRILDHLLRTQILEILDHQLLVLGVQAERAFGAMNFFALYSVFETAAEMTVKTRDGRVVGTLETLLVRRMKDKQFTFLLAGRTWLAVDVDLGRALVVAVPFAGGEAPRWHGASGSLGPEVAAEMRNILISYAEFPFVDDAGREEIRRRQEMLRAILDRDRCAITREGKKLRIHTYAGGRINATISALLESAGVGRVTSFGDLELDLEPTLGSVAGEAMVRAELRGLRDVGARLGDAERANLVDDKYRGQLAKFQPCLPRSLEGSYLAENLFDFEGTARLAGESSFPII